MARGDFDQEVEGYFTLGPVKPDIAERFHTLCAKRDVEPGKMFETMVRSFDRGSTTYGLDMRMDFGKYAGMNVEDVIRTDTGYMSWLARTSEWFKLTDAAERLMKQMEA